MPIAKSTSASLPRDGIAMIVFLGSLAAIAPLAIDMGLPGFSATAAAMSVPEGQMPHSLALFLLGFSVGPLLLGPLADRYGRRPILMAGLAVFIAGGLGTALATTFPILLLCRTIQGIGAGVAATIPFAIARDIYQGDVARVRMSAMSLVLGIGPIAAPLLGSAVLSIGGWRAIYATLATAGLVLFVVTLAGLAESAPSSPSRVTSRSVFDSYRIVLTNRRFMGNSLVNASAFATMFAYIAGSPALLMGNLGLSSGAYSLVFGFNAAAAMLGSYVNGRLAARAVASTTITRAATKLMASSSILLVGLSFLGAVTPLSFAALVALTLFGLGMVGPNVTHDALQPMAATAGVATAVLRAMQMLAAGAATGLVGLLHDGKTAHSVAAVMTLFALASAVLLRIAGQKKSESS